MSKNKTVALENKTVALTSQPSRLADLTDRECANLLGGTIGGLCNYVRDVETVRRAVRWWAETDAAWRLMKAEAVTAMASAETLAEWLRKDAAR